MHDLVIRGGTLACHDGVYRADIAIDGGKISQVYPPGTAYAAQYIEADGLHILPGLIDPHVHIGYPDWNWREDCNATTRAAALGGVTTVIDFLSDATPLESQMDSVLEKLEGNAWVDVSLHAGVYTEEHVNSIEAMAERGISSFKFYLPYNCEHMPQEQRLTDDKLWEGFCRISKLGPPAIATVHAENQWIIDRLAGQIPVDESTSWSDLRPVFVEADSVNHAGNISRAAGCPLYIVHVSSRIAAQEMSRLRRGGVDITGETCAHYLILNNGNCERTLGKINPPLREKDDNDALWEAIREGTVACIGSDHSSCSLSHKNGFLSATPGFAGVQTTLPVLLDGVNRGKLSLQQMVAASSYNAAKCFGLSGRKGSVKPGFDADLVLVDMKAERVVTAGSLAHISDYTPFEGITLKGWPVMTLLRGEPVAGDGRIISNGARGCFVPRNTYKGN